MKVKRLYLSCAAAVLCLATCGVDTNTPNQEQSDTSASLEKDDSRPRVPPYETVTVASGGSVQGTVRFTGDLPVESDVPVLKDQEVCGDSQPNPMLRSGPGGALEGAVVSLVGISKGKELQTPARVAELELIKCSAVPHAQLVPVGSTFEIYNSDPILHEVQAWLGENRLLFSVALPIENFRVRKKLEPPGIIKLRCAAGHTWMSSFVVVQEHPYYALTNSRGFYEISDIPPGSYRLRVWHEVLGEKEAPLVVESGVAANVDVQLTGKTGHEMSSNR